MWGPCARDNRNFLWLLRLDGYPEPPIRWSRSLVLALALFDHVMAGLREAE